MRIAIYARVSTEEQKLEQQIEPCIKRCQSEGWDFVVYEEKISGAKQTRPQLDIMLQHIRQKEIDAVMVYKLDRLGRSTQHLLQVLSELRNKNIPFISITEGFDTNTPMGRFGLSIMAALAQMERELISERTRARLEYLKSKGVKLGRPMGAKDKKPRRKAGYNLRWVGGKAKNKWGKRHPPNNDVNFGL
jgi:DNA invertase Pin-like site-specific DNA recombinase